MDRLSRLKLLFEHDGHLLQLNTGLRKRLPAADNEDEPSSPVLPEMSSQPAPTVQSESPVTTPSIPSDGIFCPLLALSKYPYKYLQGEMRDKVANRFFERGLFWKRQWDLYYIHLRPQNQQTVRHLLLVPAAQARHLLHEINNSLESSLVFPTQNFFLDFTTHAFPFPVFLGQSTSREDKEQLEGNIPASLAPEHKVSAPDDEYLAYAAMLESGWEAAKGKRTKVSKEKMAQRVQKERDRIVCLQRLQRYLGLRGDAIVPKDSSGGDPAENQEPPGTKREAVDENQPTPHPFWKEPIFISVDIECNERCHSQVTEVGISVLDTRDLVGVPPGENCSYWRRLIQSRHLRVREHGHIVNRDFVPGCPKDFQFGTSEWVDLDQLGDTVRACFQAPSGADDEERTLILVAHSTGMEETYLRKLGVPVLREGGKPFFAEIVDTAEFFKVIQGETATRSLGAVLLEVGIEGWYLHNGGNDARYSMEAMLGMMWRWDGVIPTKTGV
ncbi:hypothetical protein P168DRAFT_314439 [Aspergillus campestris IBT 28561]|uniref:Gfd2/YDR514C-like C-terminal domain-containing protein n=1 Tax=Aspergillus campestris (strain IBT 28561) TaxID=1392248 RepID=A0A2I1DEN9_ASPC2|nr:uncharacterized protein P168DRAFT_314439 [Aspergillus campestris IBT 28561]PKY08334.1 hypothetical protein P168DRAFT_314439 [Aspergillus campestris IBT 28561]